MKKTLSISAAVFAALFSFNSAWGANLVVSNSSDSGAGSLRQQLLNASAGDTISFATGTNGQTIVLSSILTLDKDLVIMGNGSSNSMLSGGGSSQIFEVISGAMVQFEGLSIMNGLSTMSGGAIVVQGAELWISDCSLSNNEAQGAMAVMGGGAIWNTAGSELHIMNTSFSNNQASGASGSGGAILNDGSSVLTISMGTSFSANSSNRAGGAIEDNSGANSMVQITDASFTGNSTGTAPGNGGAIHITGAGQMMISNSSFNSNSAGNEGGALWNGSGSMSLNNILADGNIASGAAGDSGGGAIYNLGGDLTIMNSILSNNIANGSAGSGGAVLNDLGGMLEIQNTSITGNMAMRAGGGVEDNSSSAPSSMRFQNVTLSNNSTGTAPGNGGGLHITGAGNLLFDGGTVSGNTAAAEGGGLWNGTAQMTLSNVNISNNVANGPLADNGGGGLYNLGGQIDILNGTQINNNQAAGAAGSGGGILNDMGGMINISNSMIMGNMAMRAGGGIECTDSSGVLLVNTMLNNNSTGSAPGNGGGLHVTGYGMVSLSGGTVSNNMAASEGGGLWNGTGAMSISGTNIDGNSAAGNTFTEGGGGIYNQGGIIDIINNTQITNNSATGTAGSGGGILNDMGGTLNVSHSTIMGNSSMRAGGGIEDNSMGASGTLNLNMVQLLNNDAGTAPGNGGGLHISGLGNTYIIGGLVSGNLAASEGGGLWNGGGYMLVNGTIIDGNTASGAAADNGGGGIYNQDGILEITNMAEITNNVADGAAGSGGGILNVLGGRIRITNVLIANNSAMRAGGGIEDNSTAGIRGELELRDFQLSGNVVGSAPGNGGGLHITGPGNATLINGSVINNEAASEGGGLWNGSGMMYLQYVSIVNNEALGAAADNGGAGIFNNGGDLILDGCTVNMNMATGAAASGGGLLSVAGDVDIQNTDFDNNAANRAGGAIELIDGNCWIVNSVFEANDVNGTAGTAAPGNGGAIHISGATMLYIDESEFIDNEAAREGGALWNQSNSQMYIYNSTIMNNSAFGTAADDGGGGFFNNGGDTWIEGSTFSGNNAANANGGAIQNQTGMTAISRSTISGNMAAMDGAGIYNADSLTAEALTIAFNMASGNAGGIAQNSMRPLGLKSTIVSNNTASMMGQDIYLEMGMLNSMGYNLVQDTSGMSWMAGMGDLLGLDPFLQTLANNGGPTMTHAILVGTSSPAVDAGDPMSNMLDQRGMSINGRRDIGAFESAELLSNHSLAQLTNIKAYPNPTLDIVQLEREASSQSTYQLYSLEGRLLQTGQLNDRIERINLSDFPAGTYFLQLEEGQRLALIKE
ncbi:T9SS type A sorting domain-containing protein [Saprospira sp. CCB-QB6]|uniref:choice-of-anchor Q domain-containing protein n=1 Tax=Saprospira sp. CCB-QB6 TaxID=3023936 RepID=UPI00234A3AD9|nr:choice-of-anchor Q domain-containing protein [Saprospira sp. CCB-QB6]WCL80223.1 T9SS type A sorting domain-containing protein [Saprospira sp. CCB-QB6]